MSPGRRAARPAARPLVPLLGGLALGATLGHGTALAQDPAFALPELTVTATRAARPIEEVPQTVQVIEREEIERQLTLSPSPAAAIARLIPGYTLPTQTISGASEGFRGRDALVLLDGVPLNTPLRDVSRMLAMLDLNAVERIETVAGASSLYGAGATGGTINIITRRPTEGGPRFTVNTALRAFTADTGQSLSPEMSLGVTGRTEGGFDYVIVGTGRSTGRTYDGAGREMPSDAMLGQGGGDRTLSGNLLTKFGYDIDAARRLDVSAMLIRLDQDPAWLTDYSGSRAQPDFNAPYTGRSIMENSSSLSARWTDQDFALGTLSLLAYHNDIQKRFNYTTYNFPNNSLVYYSGNPASPTSPANQTTLYSQRTGLNATVDTPLDGLLRGLLLTWGADVSHERTHQTLTTGEEVFTPLEQMTYAAFGQLQFPVGERLTLRSGLRYERFDLSVDDFTRPTVYYGIRSNLAYILPALRVTGGEFSYDATTWNLGATYRITPETEAYGGFSQGFALPDVGAFTRRAGLSLAYACTVAQPNCLPTGTSVSYASIAPEAQIVNSYELGLRHRGQEVRGNLVGFVSTSDKGVTFDNVTNTLSQQKEIIYGLELTAEWDLSRAFTLGSLLSWREGEYDSDRNGDIDSYLPNNRIPTPLRGAISGTWRFEGGTQIRTELVGFTGRSRPINETGTRHEIEPGATVNLAVATPVGNGQFYASVDNLFDAAYQNPTATSVRNLPVESWGRTVTIGFRQSL